MAYEVPVDLDACSEEERRSWLIRRANIRNGGRLRENPLWDDASTTGARVVDPEDCKSADGSWRKFVKERLSEEELALLEELNQMCD